jgi:hypothetical protein
MPTIDIEALLDEAQTTIDEIDKTGIKEARPERSQRAPRPTTIEPNPEPGFVQNIKEFYGGGRRSFEEKKSLLKKIRASRPPVPEGPENLTPPKLFQWDRPARMNEPVPELGENMTNKTPLSNAIRMTLPRQPGTRPQRVIQQPGQITPMPEEPGLISNVLRAAQTPADVLTATGPMPEANVAGMNAEELVGKAKPFMQALITRAGKAMAQGNIPAAREYMRRAQQASAVVNKAVSAAADARQALPTSEALPMVGAVQGLPAVLGAFQLAGPGGAGALMAGMAAKDLAADPDFGKTASRTGKALLQYPGNMVGVNPMAEALGRGAEPQSTLDAIAANSTPTGAGLDRQTEAGKALQLALVPLMSLKGARGARIRAAAQKALAADAQIASLDKGSPAPSPSVPSGTRRIPVGVDLNSPIDAASSPYYTHMDRARGKTTAAKLAARADSARLRDAIDSGDAETVMNLVEQGVEPLAAPSEPVPETLKRLNNIARRVEEKKAEVVAAERAPKQAAPAAVEPPPRNLMALLKRGKAPQSDTSGVRGSSPEMAPPLASEAVSGTPAPKAKAPRETVPVMNVRRPQVGKKPAFIEEVVGNPGETHLRMQERLGLDAKDVKDSWRRDLTTGEDVNLTPEERAEIHKKNNEDYGVLAERQLAEAEAEAAATSPTKRTVIEERDGEIVTTITEKKAAAPEASPLKSAEKVGRESVRGEDPELLNQLSDLPRHVLYRAAGRLLVDLKKADSVARMRDKMYDELTRQREQAIEAGQVDKFDGDVTRILGEESGHPNKGEYKALAAAPIGAALGAMAGGDEDEDWKSRAMRFAGAGALGAMMMGATKGEGKGSLAERLRKSAEARGVAEKAPEAARAVKIPVTEQKPGTVAAHIARLNDGEEPQTYIEKAYRTYDEKALTDPEKAFEEYLEILPSSYADATRSEVYGDLKASGELGKPESIAIKQNLKDWGKEKARIAKLKAAGKDVTPKKFAKYPDVNPRGAYATGEVLKKLGEVKEIKSRFMSWITNQASVLAEMDGGKPYGAAQELIQGPMHAVLEADGKYKHVKREQFWKTLRENDIVDYPDLAGVADAMEGKTDLPANYIKAAKELRPLFDGMRKNQNAVREKRGIEQIGYIENYVKHAREYNEVTEFLDSMSEKDRIGLNQSEKAVDFLHPKGVFVAHALKRTGGMKNLDRNIASLFQSYLRAASQDIFYTPAMDYMKVVIKDLREVYNLENTPNYLEAWTDEVLGGMAGSVDRPLIAKGAKPLLAFTSMLKRHLASSALALNPKWNLLTQATGSFLVPARFGKQGVIDAKLYWSDPFMRSEVQSAHDYRMKNQGMSGENVTAGDKVSQLAKKRAGTFSKVARKFDPLFEIASGWTESIESGTFGMAYAAAYKKLSRMTDPSTGKPYSRAACRRFANNQAGQISGLFGRENVPEILRNRIVDTTHPFQAFTMGMLGMLRESLGKTGHSEVFNGLKPSAKTVLVNTGKFLGALQLISELQYQTTGTRSFSPLSFLPFASAYLPTNLRGGPLVSQWSSDMLEAFGAIGKDPVKGAEKVVQAMLRWHLKGGAGLIQGARLAKNWAYGPDKYRATSDSPLKMLLKESWPSWYKERNKPAPVPKKHKSGGFNSNPFKSQSFKSLSF